MSRGIDDVRREAMAAGRAGRHDEALAGFDEIAARLRRRMEEGDTSSARRLAAAQADRALALSRLERPDAALGAHEEILRILGSIDAVDGADPDRTDAMLGRAVALHQLGRFAEEIAQFEQLLPLLRDRAESGDPGARRMVAGVVMDWALLLATDRRHEAVAGYAEASHLLDELVRSGRDELRHDLVVSLQEHARLMRLDGRLDQALVDLERAVATLQPVVLDPEESEAGELVRALMARGVVLGAMAHPARAGGSLDEARGVMHQLLDAGRDDDLYAAAHGLFLRTLDVHAAGLHDIAVDFFDEAIALLRELVALDLDLRIELATMQASRAMALDEVGREMEVLPGLDEAVQTWRDVMAAGFHDHVSHLVSTLALRGAVQRERGDLAAAVRSAEDALESLAPPWVPDDSTLLATTLVQLSQLQDEIGDHAGAIAGCDAAVVALGTDEDDDAVRTHAQALTVRAGALGSQGRHADAVHTYDEALVILGGLPADGSLELARRRAGVLVNRGLALEHSGHHESALESLDAGIEMLRDTDDDSELPLLLGRAVSNRSMTLDSLGRQEEALLGYDEVERLCRRAGVVADPETEALAADAQINRAAALITLDRPAQASAACHAAILVLRRLVGQGHSHRQDDLAAALINLGGAARLGGHFAESLDSLAEADLILRAVVASGRDDVVPDLALVARNRANTQGAMGDGEAAVESLAQAVEILEEMVAGGREDLLDELARTMVALGNSLDSVGEHVAAIDSFDGALLLIDELSGAGRDDLTEDAADLMNDRAVSLQSLGRDEEALGAVDAAERRLGGRLASATAVFIVSTRAELLESLGRGSEALVVWQRVAAMAQALPTTDEHRPDLQEISSEALARFAAR